MTDWASIVQQHAPGAARAAFRVLGDAGDAEDALQDALLDALRLHEKQRIENWPALLRRLAVCRALDLLRKRHPAAALDAESVMSRSSRPEAVAVANERAIQVRAALVRLPEREGQIFSLRYFGELSNREIAGTLNLSEGAVAVALHKARERLQIILEEKE